MKIKIEPFKHFLIFITIGIVFTGCYWESDLIGTYSVDNSIVSDTLTLLDNHLYNRKYTFHDSVFLDHGKWFMEDNHHVSFSNWSDKNELLPGSTGDFHKGLCYFSFGVSSLKFDGKIYYDLNNLSYYRKINTN